MRNTVLLLAPTIAFRTDTTLEPPLDQFILVKMLRIWWM